MSEKCSKFSLLPKYIKGVSSGVFLHAFAYVNVGCLKFEVCCLFQAVWFISGTQQHTVLSTNWTAPNWCLALRALNLSALKSISVQDNARCVYVCVCVCLYLYKIG
jgi:hypothetical protein